MFFFSSLYSQLEIHDKHANWTIIKPSAETNINSHFVLSSTLVSHLTWACSLMKANFQFSIFTLLRMSRMNEMEKEKRRTSDENTWSQITSENVNQYWLIFDCFQIIPLVDQLKIEHLQQSLGWKGKFLSSYLFFLIFFLSSL